MKHAFSILLLFVTLITSAQQMDATLMHDGLEREYILYVPESYTGMEPVSMVFNFHGYTSNSDEQLLYGDFRSIADTAGFILVVPQGERLNGITHWNVGGWTAGSTVDDIGFTEAMIDQISQDYNINPDRIYSTGMSNGGFMSYQLACQLGDRIAAVASVTGSMTTEIYNDCNPQHPTPVLQIHGTVDPVIPYNGNNSWSVPIEDILAYWVDFNNCAEEPEVADVPNSTIVDGSTVDHFIYTEGDNGVKVEHFKIFGGGHTWPGTFFTSPGTNYDINASEEIWKFFSRYDINGELTITNTEEVFEASILNAFPNPTNALLRVELNKLETANYRLMDQAGKVVLEGQIENGNQEIDLSALPATVYFLKVKEQTLKVLKLD